MGGDVRLWRSYLPWPSKSSWRGQEAQVLPLRPNRHPPVLVRWAVHGNTSRAVLD
jgi:hypothetical protein